MPGKMGKVVQVIGPVIDIKFDSDSLPNLYNAIHINLGEETLVAEVEQHVGDDIVRAIAMEATEGLRRGMDAVDTGKPIAVPVGDEVLGRLFNVLGNPMDNKDFQSIKKDIAKNKKCKDLGVRLIESAKLPAMLGRIE